MKTNKRSRTKQYPLGIDSSKLPVGCYWDDRRKHWYTRFNDLGVRRNRIIGKETATMQDLWKAMEEPDLETSSFQWLFDKYKQSAKWASHGKDTRNSYNNTIRILNEMETKTIGTFISDTNRHNWTPVLMQNMIDKIAIKTPTTSHRAKENISAIFNWGIRRGHAITNPASIVELCKLNPKQRLPSKVLVAKLTEFAINGSKLKPHTKGSIPKAIWKSLELAFLNRLRGIEVRHLTDDHILSDGLMCERAKGSSTNVTLWDDRLQHVINKCVDDRDALWKKKGRAYPLRPEHRFLVVNNSGDCLTKSGWQSIWRSFLERAIKAEIMVEEDWFGLHDIKRRGTTDTEGTAEVKLEATGHKSRAMLPIYDKSIARVKTPK
jgi:site-specific recombinase XerD|tara:strand:+ start:405 stop:1538 length:1134 start_codon:yes stop_codon:yes gene_type:complete